MGERQKEEIGYREQEETHRKMRKWYGHLVEKRYVGREGKGRESKGRHEEEARRNEWGRTFDLSKGVK